MKNSGTPGFMKTVPFNNEDYQSITQFTGSWGNCFQETQDTSETLEYYLKYRLPQIKPVLHNVLHVTGF